MLPLRAIFVDATSPARCRGAKLLARRLLGLEATARLRPTAAAVEDRGLSIELLEEGVAVFGMHRPSAKNAMDITFFNQLEEGVRMVRGIHGIRAAILTSEVPGVFCAGGDLKERTRMTDMEIKMIIAKGQRVFTDLAELPMPVISAIDGLALGGGLELALATDIRVAADNAKIGMIETRNALIPGRGGTQRLPRLVGIGKAKQLIFTAKVITGQEALDIGLVEELVAQNDDGNAAYMKALELAMEISDKGPVAIAAAKHAIDKGMQTDLNTSMHIEELCHTEIIPTWDRLEALAAFAEGRKPVFKGK